MLLFYGEGTKYPLQFFPGVSLPSWVAQLPLTNMLSPPNSLLFPIGENVGQFVYNIALVYLQNFALGKGDEEVISTLQYFSKVVDEVIQIVSIVVCILPYVCLCH